MLPQQQIADNYRRICDEVSEAAIGCGRAPESIRIIGVTKYFPSEFARFLFIAGCKDLGESRPQELWKKADELVDLEVRWHFIGHLQRNKSRRTLPLVNLIHSVDSQRLLEDIAEESKRIGRVTPVLLEVNVSQDESKTGLAPQSVEPILACASGLPNVSIIGLMGMASLDGGSEQATRDFARLRLTRDHLQSQFPSLALSELSMGMSGDFREAIQQGSTMLRIGSALFEGIESPQQDV